MYLFNGNNLCSNNHHDLAMKKILTLAIIFLSFAVPFAQSTNMNLKHFPMLMPQVQPNTKDSYLCTAFRMPRYRTEYIVEFIPNATMETAHHIIIYGCKVPGYHVRDSPRAVWECGEMSGVVGPDSPYLRAPVCTGTYSIIYAWAMDAPSLVLPDKVGFKVGKGTDIAFLVLQVHYAKVDRFLKGDRDQSGIILSITPDSANRVNKRAGVLLLGTQGSIPAKSIEHMETSCKISQPILMHPFAFRTHTHKLGKLVTGWLIEDGKWKLLGKRDPQKPQMFYPINNESLIIKQNDVLAARCTMDNYLSHPVSVGPTGDDEMCNFYIMFWVDGDDELDEKYCFSSGPPTYYWKNDPLIGQVPDDIDREASNYIQ